MKGKRTNIDFSKHELIVTEQQGLLVHYLKKPDTHWNCLKYINTNGIMAVTGDYGNWIFCREFHPSCDGGVSDGYWVEKLKILSQQEPCEFDGVGTKDEINKLLTEEEDLSEQEVDYLNELLSLADEGEFDYTRYAYRENVGRFEDGEYIPHCKKYKYWLLAVFDGFDEICRRMKEETKNNLT